MARFILAALLLTVLVACPRVQAYEEPNGLADLDALLDCMKKDGNFTIFLKLFRDTGFKTVLAKFITTVPVTILAPTDQAVKKLPSNIKYQLKGASLIKLFETLMLEQKWTYYYMSEIAKPNSFFKTVYGNFIYKQPSATEDTVLLSMAADSDPADMAVITHPDLCNQERRLGSVQGISTVLIPFNVFRTASI